MALTSLVAYDMTHHADHPFHDVHRRRRSGCGPMAQWAWAVAAATAMTLRLNGMSNWIMWELAGLFEHIGTVCVTGPIRCRNGKTVVDAPRPTTCRRAEIRFENVTFSYVQDRREKSAGDTAAETAAADAEAHFRELVAGPSAPARRLARCGRSGAGKSTIVNLLLRFTTSTVAAS